MKVEAFFFDLDGTLVDTEAVWAGAIVDYLTEHDEHATESEILNFIVGRSWLDINIRLHEKYSKLGCTSIEEDSRNLRRLYAKRVQDPAQLVIKPSIEFLHKVSALAPVAIVSGSPHADILAAADMCGIAEKLAFVLGAEDYPKGKPDAAPYLTAAAKLGVKAEGCIVIEDSNVGIASGIAAGMNVIALRKMPHSIEGVWKTVSSLSEIDVQKEFQ